MKLFSIAFLSAMILLSCDKSDDDTQEPVNNGPIGGTYVFAGATTNTYDTTSGVGILTTNHYTTTTTNHKGSVTITANNIASKGLMYDYTTTGTQKETNTSTGATVTTNRSPLTGTSGATTTSYNSNYTIDVAAGELTINDGQYLFSPAFMSQPSNKKYSYTLTGNSLVVTSDAYNASSRSRTVHQATFTKQ